MPTDAPAHDRVREVAELLRYVSGVEDPQEIQQSFGRRLRDMNRIDGYVAVSRRDLAEGEYKLTRVLLTADDMRSHPVNPWTQWDDLPTHRGGFIGSIITEDEPKRFGDLHVTGDPALADLLAEFRSAVALPLFDGGRALNWSVMLRRDADAFSIDEIEQMLMQGNLIGRMTRNLVIQRQVRELNARLSGQLDEIAQLQRSLLPDRLPQIPGLSIAASYLPSQQAGGDYYDFIPLDDGRWVFLIADVSGHGAGAATVVAMLNAIVHSHPEAMGDPAAVAMHANRQLAAKRIESNFVTAFVGLWDPESRRLTYANAGHHPPTLRLADGGVRALTDAHSVPLGILADVDYERADVRLEPGQTLVLYTDGITEAFGPGGPEREMFGLDRLCRALVDCSGMPQCVIDSIHERLYQFTQSRTREDDQTLLALRVTD